jgi:hypothetical protein
MAEAPRRTPVNEMPTLDGAPPPADVQQQVVSNQVRSARDWNDTAQDIVLNNIVNENDQARQTRWQMVALVMVVLVLLIFGSWWTYNNIMHDRFVERERGEAARTPYTPETVR